MARARASYLCQQCGAESAQWLGRCPVCEAWNTLVEFRVTESTSARRGGPAVAAAPVSATALDAQVADRLAIGLGEVDRVLGGGVVPGALILLAGDPGIGKSTLLLQAAHSFAAAHGTSLYVSGEESVAQVALRNRRLKALSSDLMLLTENDAEAISRQVQKAPPGLLVVDSIQAMYAAEVPAPPGAVSQVRECAARLMRVAKELAVPTILVGHVTKEGVLAGPRLLEHMVDTVLSLEGDRHSEYRILRSSKNRFGSTDEVGLFAMTETGLEGIPDASAALLAQRRAGRPGSTVVATMEGSRPLLIEVQALVTRASSGGTPRRSVTGLDYGRACLILAVLEKRAGIPLASADVFINVPGGLRVTEPAADLAMALAVSSSYQDEPVPDGLACIGEVGLTGEIRSVPRLGRRLSELARRGFRLCLVPRQAEARAPANIEAVVVETIAEALRACRLAT